MLLLPIRQDRLQWSGMARKGQAIEAREFARETRSNNEREKKENRETPTNKEKKKEKTY